ncbi:hypothetical protein NBO_717g0001 [Nosema bombycis CQ1]|uniref:Uncharacterized protein n=1 Tax=Nosema bombycis (strain CQ1 / CVCC 102059) TaxID=578461 RepID=R0M1H6_NOSB1|nr:hypothetical protein NBO_717g0001 [Nosema bombycis CQ1]|eukprot:EOB11859.1 hypothetical protein NBO_717g0001 [Nosema bombycis CQ1]
MRQSSFIPLIKQFNGKQYARYFNIQNWPRFLSSYFHEKINKKSFQAIYFSPLFYRFLFLIKRYTHHKYF